MGARGRLVRLADLLWHLECLGVRVSLRSDGRFNVGPASLLTPTLSDAIRAHRDWLRQLVLRAEYDAHMGEGDGSLILAVREYDGIVPADWCPPPASALQAA